MRRVISTHPAYRRARAAGKRSAIAGRSERGSFAYALTKTARGRSIFYGGETERGGGEGRGRDINKPTETEDECNRERKRESTNAINAIERRESARSRNKGSAAVRARDKIHGVKFAI